MIEKRKKSTDYIRIFHILAAASIGISTVVFKLMERAGEDIVFGNPRVEWFMYFFTIIPMFYILGYVIGTETSGIFRAIILGLLLCFLAFCPYYIATH